jgi:hypothetical protein
MAIKLTEKTKDKLPINYLSNTTKLDFHPHCTLIHIANQDESNKKKLLKTFNRFSKKYNNNTCIQLPIKGIIATGGDIKQGFKWLDVQFMVSDELLALRKKPSLSFLHITKECFKE